MLSHLVNYGTTVTCFHLNLPKLCLLVTWYDQVFIKRSEQKKAQLYYMSLDHISRLQKYHGPGNDVISQSAAPITVPHAALEPLPSAAVTHLG